jgi:hypothetical protein
MSEGGLGPAAAACLFPGFEGEVVPDWLKGLLAGGLGGVVLSRATSVTPARRLRWPGRCGRSAASCSSQPTRRAAT